MNFFAAENIDFLGEENIDFLTRENIDRASWRENIDFTGCNRWQHSTAHRNRRVAPAQPVLTPFSNS
ncbi:hypothetical protein ACO0K7_09175 [Undibacterium sp. Ji67W]